MSHRDSKTIAALVDTNAQALFDAYGVQLKQGCDSPRMTTYAAIIGYSGRELSGSLCITTVPEVSAKTYGGDAPADWLGELANQLLGRLKTDLAKRGAEVYLTTPLVLKGYRLQVCPNDEHGIESVHQDYECEEGPVTVMFQYEFKHGCNLSPTQHIENALDVSDAILF
ncbi:MAG: chemotaxis protein CheX [Polyangiaceae bacterium]|nr:chemotaxis protein CheX [Polyangiaceae bacterium]